MAVMERQYLKQTKASLAKVKEPVNLRERLQALSATVTELKQDMRQELTAAETLERVEKMVIQTQNHSTLNSQVQALRRAFSELADAVADEVERLQEDTKADLRRDVRSLVMRMEALTEQNQTLTQSTAELNVAMTAQMRQTNETLVVLQRTQDHLHEEVSELKETLLKAQDDNKQVFEQMRSILHNNITHTAGLQKGQKRISEEVKSLSGESANALHLIEEQQKAALEVEARLTASLRTLENNIQDLAIQVKTAVAGNAAQERSAATVQLSSKVQDMSGAIQQRLELLTNYIDDKNRDLEVQLEELKAKVEVRDSEGAPSEDREVRQRVDYLETMLQTQRREIFATVTTLEQSTMKKYDSVVKAIYSIARELNLQNPMTAY